MASLKDIAQQLDLSVSAVSMAINGHHSISAKTKEKVLETCARLGWQNIRRTKRGRPRKAPEIGLKNRNVAFLLIDRSFDDPAYSGLFQGVTMAAREAQLAPISYSVHSSDFKDGRQPVAFNEKRLDGVILSGVFDGEIEEWASRLSIPTLLIGTYFKVKEIASCEIDVSQGADLLLHHLRSLGHERIGLILEQPRLYISRLLREAYTRDCLECETQVDQGLIKTFNAPATEAQIGEVLDAWLKSPQPPSAVILPSERLVRAFFEAATSQGLKIPEDLSVTCFGNPETGFFSRTSITLAHPKLRDVGKGAVRKLLNMIQEPTASKTREVFPMYLSEGASSAARLGSSATLSQPCISSR